MCLVRGRTAHSKNRLFNAVYPELRRLAASKIRSEDSAISIQATDLVHEAYLKLSDQKQAVWKNREQFFAVAAVLIRRILVDRARHRQRQRSV